MPGSPATSPNFAIPRFSNADAADFSADANASIDAIDANMRVALNWSYHTLPSGTGTAANQDFWIAAGGSTVNLPAPTAGRAVAVQADDSVTGASQATVTTPSGAIKGLGLGLVSASLKLGTPGASVVLVADGTNYRVVSGAQNTGWMALTLSTNIGVTSGFDTPAARLIGDVVYLRGSLQNNTGGAISNGTQIATVPTIMRPATSNSRGMGTSGTNDIIVTMAGAFMMASVAWPAATRFAIDFMSYPMS